MPLSAAKSDGLRCRLGYRIRDTMRRGLAGVSFSSQCRARWEKLKQLRPQNARHTAAPSEIDGLQSTNAASVSEVEELARGRYGTHRKLNNEQARLVVQDLGRTYVSSCPGADNAGPNVAFHRYVRQLVEGTMLPSYKVEELQSILIFRMESTKLGTGYCRPQLRRLS